MKTSNFLLALVSIPLLTSSIHAQIAEKAEDIAPLLISEKVPEVSVTTLDGEETSLKKIVAQQPAVVVFYRGGWCPYCNSHLSELSSIEGEIIKLGYQMVAISPDAPSRIDQTVEKAKLNYQLFSDADGKLMQAMGIAFQAPERYDDRLQDFSGGLNDGLLPVPSVFVVNKEGVILFEYISPNYRQRISADLLLAVLGSLENTSGE